MKSGRINKLEMYMAYGRMLGANISISEKVADLSSAEVKLFYTWSLAHTDDLRLLPASPRELKAKVMPYEAFDNQTVTKWVEELIRKKLYIKIEYSTKNYLYVPDPSRVNNLRKDRKIKTIFPIDEREVKNKKQIKDLWDHYEELIDNLISRCQSVDSQLTVNCLSSDSQVTVNCQSLDNRLPSEVKGREEKRRECKNNGETKKIASPEIKNLPKDVLGVPADAILGSSSSSNSGIYYAWQDKAFRFAEHLGIKLDDPSVKSRWLKLFKDHQKSSKLDTTASYLVDYIHYKALKDDVARVKYFFAMFYNRA